MNVQILNPNEDPKWDEKVLQFPGATLFHSSHWSRVLSESYGYTPQYFTLVEGEKIRGLFPIMEVRSLLTGKRGVSLPFTDFCDPLLSDCVDFGDLWNQVVAFSKKQGWKYIEFRTNTFDVSRFPSNGFSSQSCPSPQPCITATPQPCSPAAQQHCNTASPQPSNLESGSLSSSPSTFGPRPPFLSYVGHSLSLDQDEEPLLRSFRDSTQRNIRKASGEGVQITISESMRDLKKFVRLNSLTRREHGLPPQPERFFEKLHDHVLSKGHGWVILGAYGGQTVAGAVFLHFGEKAHYKYGASDRRFQHLRANNLVMCEAIRGYARKGVKSLCFGRTEPDHTGLLQFKAGWNPEVRPIRYFRFDIGKGAFVSGTSRVNGFHNEVFRRMPIPLLNRVGSLLYRHVG